MNRTKNWYKYNRLRQSSTDGILKVYITLVSIVSYRRIFFIEFQWTTLLLRSHGNLLTREIILKGRSLLPSVSLYRNDLQFCVQFKYLLSTWNSATGGRVL